MVICSTKMAHSRPRAKPYVPSEKDIYFEVKVTGGYCDSTVSHEIIGERLKGVFSCEKRDTNAVPSSTSLSATHLKYRLKQRGFTKSDAFEIIRQRWCTKVCKPGDPFWLESAETPLHSFPNVDVPSSQVLQPKSFSLGSFYDRGSFVEHYSSENDSEMIESELIQAEFEHDLKRVELVFTRANELSSLGIGFPGTEQRLEFEYKQFEVENYVVVDESREQGRIDIYFPLLWPAKVSKGEKNTKDYTNYIRCTSFLNCDREVLGRSSVLRLRFGFPAYTESNLPIQLITRLGRLGFTIYFAAMKTRSPRGLTEVPTKPDITNFSVSFALECLLSRGFKVSDRVTRVFYDKLRRATSRYQAIVDGSTTIDSSKICRAIYHLIATIESDRFCNLEEILEQLLYGSKKRKSTIDIEIPKHYVYVPRIIITPSQDYLVQPELVAENRVIREYGHEYTMRIAFRDEDFGKLSSPFSNGLRDILKTRVQDLLSVGITLCGRHFEFLACSNSQLRQHGAWLYAHDGEHSAADIRGSLGELEEIRCVATYVSRMGQCFSSTKKAVQVSLDEGARTVEEIPDITKDYQSVFFECCQNYRTGTYIFSDGVGKISKALAHKVAKSLGLEHSPSAYQIRYAGCKGMLAIDPSLPRGDTRSILQYRKSMKKFQSSHEALEICEYSKPNRLYLNRQCITLLSGLKVPDETFIRLQDTMLMRLASMLLFETTAIDSLNRTNIPGGLKVSVLRQSGINVTCEPFFRSMLLAIYRSKLGDLLRRARIAIPESHGRLLMGVLDETGTLEYGQVFIRYTTEISEPGSGLTTLTGDVVVSKNPCFHPGDMRKFKAVDVRALRHLVDCIVFPAKGERPHTDEMSGSDLDGDKYFVTWYPDLLPPGDNEEAMDFAAPPKKVVNREIDVSDMIQFVSDYIKNDQLGLIANAHLVHADLDNEGIFSSACIELAHKHSDAVDFPKTGECPELTRELRPERYPDFMMKPDKPKYKSERVLGKLFQKCNSLERARRFMSEAGAGKIKVDQDMILEGHQKYIDEALEMRERYNTKLESLMSLYGLKNEGEVITGCLIKVNSRLSGKTDEKFEVAQMIQASLATLRSSLRHDFYSEFGGEQEVMEAFGRDKAYPEDVLLKASAWYAVTYNNTQATNRESDSKLQKRRANAGNNVMGIVTRRTRAQAGSDVMTRSLSQEHAQYSAERGTASMPSPDEESGSDVILLSFPWVVDRLLADIKRRATEHRRGDSRQNALEGIGILATDQACYYFLEKQQTMIIDFEMRQAERDRFLATLLRYPGNHAMQTSLVGASLTELNTGAKDLQPLQVYIHISWTARGRQQTQILEQQSRVISLHTREFVSPRGDPPYIRFKASTVPDLHYYVTADPELMLKSAYVSLHVQRCPRLLHVLLIIAHWARKRHLVGNVRDSFMSVEDLAVLFVLFCETAGYIQEIQLNDVRQHAEKLLSRTANMEDVWKTTVLSPASALTDDFTGFINGAQPGLVLVKFLEHYSLYSDADPLRISNVLNPVNPQNCLLPELSNEDTQRFCDAALHAYHDIATCNGLEGLLRSAEHETLKEVQETLTLHNSTWGVVRFAEEFVASQLTKITGAKISVRPAQRGNGYLMEILGNYLTLYKTQNELYRLQGKTEGTSAYNHLINSGKRFIFMNQSGDRDPVRATKMKKGDFAINLTSGGPSGGGEDERKFLVAVETQLNVFQRCYTEYLHGSNRLRVSVEFGSIYVANAHVWVLGGDVGMVEGTIASNGQRNQGNNRPPFLKWNSLRSNSPSPWECAFPNRNLVSTTTVYIAEILAGKNNHTVVYDEGLKFKEIQIPPFRWLEADVKVPRPASAKKTDIDFRVIMASQRDIQLEDAKSLPTYGRFGSREVLSKTNNNLSVVPEFRRKVAYFREEVRSVYELESHQGVFLEVCTCKKYDTKASPLTIPRETYLLRLYGEFNGEERASGRAVCKSVWSAAKALQPFICH